MLLIANDKNKKQIFDIFKKWDLEYTIIGKVTNNGLYSVCDEGYEIYNEDIENFDCPNLEWDLNPYLKIVK